MKPDFLKLLEILTLSVQIPRRRKTSARFIHLLIMVHVFSGRISIKGILYETGLLKLIGKFRLLSSHLPLVQKFWRIYIRLDDLDMIIMVHRRI